MLGKREYRGEGVADRMTGDGAQPAPLTMAAFLAAVVMGGGNFIGVAFSNKELAPLHGATVRFGAAAACFFAITLLSGYRLPRGRAATGAAIYGLLGFGSAYGLLYYAIDGLGAGTTSVLVASAPLATLVLAVVFGQERFTTRGVVGGVLVIVGFAILSIDRLGTADRPIYLIAGLLGVLSIAGSSVVIKGYPQAHPVTSNAIGMAAGAIILAVGSLIFGEQWTMPVAGRTWLALLWLVGFGSVGLFILFLYVIKNWTASGAVYAVTLMPVVAIPLAALMLDERVTFPVVAGAALVIAAVYIGALRGKRPTSEVSIAAASEPVADPASGM
jgi:drug/metabolite transporter (DMT)-like permease